MQATVETCTSQASRAAMGHRDLCRPLSWPEAGCASHDSSHSPHGAFDNEIKCEVQFCCHTSYIFKASGYHMGQEGSRMLPSLQRV